MRCETVKVKNPKDPSGGYLVINREDFDPERHELWGAPVVVPVPESEPAPATRGGKRGGKAA